MIDLKQTHIVQDWTYERPLLSSRFSPDGAYVVTSAEDSTLQRWVIASGENQVLKGHESWVHALQYTPDGSQLISGGCDGRLIWWAIHDAEPLPVRTVEAHRGLDSSDRYHRRWFAIASVGNDRQIRLWDVASGEKLAEWGKHEKHIYSALLLADGQQLLTGDLAGQIHLWNWADQQLCDTFDAKLLYTYEAGQRVDFGGVRGLAMTPDGTQLLAGGLHKGSNPLGAVTSHCCCDSILPMAA